MNFEKLLELAISEDLPLGDVTTNSLKTEEKMGTAILIAKQDLVLSGRGCFEATLNKIAPQAEIKWYFTDGDKILNKQTVAKIKGNLIPVLKAERIALNFLGRLTGIATFTNKFVEKVEHTDCKILDTRKTTPGYRTLEKQAVVNGGGTNHRLNLSDQILIKENHIQIAGSLSKALDLAKESGIDFIEVEVKDLEEVKIAVDKKVQRIMLDNMNLEQTSECLKFIPTEIKSEASGNMTLDRVKSVAETGVNFISIGALTHSAPNADFSLIFEWES